MLLHVVITMMNSDTQCMQYPGCLCVSSFASYTAAASMRFGEQPRVHSHADLALQRCSPTGYVMAAVTATLDRLPAVEDGTQKRSAVLPSLKVCVGAEEERNKLFHSKAVSVISTILLSASDEPTPARPFFPMKTVLAAINHAPNQKDAKMNQDVLWAKASYSPLPSCRLPCLLGCPHNREFWFQAAQGAADSLVLAHLT